MTIKEYINKAIIENKDITIKYRKYDGTITTRKLSNVEFSDELGEGYIKAYCHLRKEKRTFRISRIYEVDGISNNSWYNKNMSYSSSSYTNSRYTPSKSTRSSKKEGCYIATMVYGDYDHPQVLILRKFRDTILSSTFLGRLFVNFYYFVSPKMVYILKRHSKINHYIKLMLDNLIICIRSRYSL